MYTFQVCPRVARSVAHFCLCSAKTLELNFEHRMQFILLRIITALYTGFIFSATSVAFFFLASQSQKINFQPIKLEFIVQEVRVSPFV